MYHRLFKGTGVLAVLTGITMASAAVAGDGWLWRKQWTGTLAGDSVNYVSANLQANHGAVFVGSSQERVYCLLKRVLGREPDGTPNLPTVSPDNPSLGSWSADSCDVRYMPTTNVEVVLVVSNTSSRNAMTSIAYGQKQ
jgi:hypothetical protein